MLTLWCHWRILSDFGGNNMVGDLYTCSGFPFNPQMWRISWSHNINTLSSNWALHYILMVLECGKCNHTIGRPSIPSVFNCLNWSLITRWYPLNHIGFSKIFELCRGNLGSWLQICLESPCIWTTFEPMTWRRPVCLLWMQSIHNGLVCLQLNCYCMQSIHSTAFGMSTVGRRPNQLHLLLPSCT